MDRWLARTAGSSRQVVNPIPKCASGMLLAVLLCCAGFCYADMNPLLSPGNKFTHILGIDLMQVGLRQVHAKLGKSPEFWSGDGAYAEGRSCYRLGDGKTTVEFQRSEVAMGISLRYRRKTDSARCAPLTGPVAERHVEIGGLKLGMSKSDVLKILGKPQNKTPDLWTYDFQGTAKDDNASERAIFRANAFDQFFPYYWELFIRVRFRGTAVIGLDVTPSVQQ